MAEEKATATAEPQPRGLAAAKHVIIGQYPPLPAPITRRKFLMSWAGWAWSTFAVANAVGAAATLRFMLPNVLFEPPQKFKAGKLEDFKWDEPDERFKPQKVWLLKLHQDWNKRAALFALDTTCTHLGCTPNVLLTENKIKCPCHGSGFRYTGVNFEGPAPRPLERYRVFIDPVDGQLVVDKTKKYHYEKGEWEDRESYIAMGSA